MATPPTFEEWKQMRGQATGTPAGASGQQAQWQSLWQKAPDIKTKNAIANSWKSAQGFELFSQPTVNATQEKQVQAGKLKQDIIDTAKQLQTVITNKNQYDPKAYQDTVNSLTSALTLKKKEADNLGAALTGTELAILSGQIPATQQIGASFPQRIGQFFTGKEPVQRGQVAEDEATIKNKLALLVAGLEGRPINPQDLQQASQPKQPQGNLLQNAGQDVKDILNGILGLPAQAIQNEYGPGGIYSKEGYNPIERIRSDAGKQAIINNSFPVVGVAKEYNQLLGEPLKGGDIVQRILDRAYQKPVTTALDILPFLGLKKGALPKGVPAEAPVVEQAAETVNPLQRILRSTSDVVSGGGSKEYLANAARSKTAIPQNQVLLEEGILTHPTATGKITSTAKSMEKYGSQIGDIYRTAKDPISGTELGKALDTQLKDMGYTQKDINMIKTYINDQGGFDLKSGDISIPQEKAWQTARKIEQHAPKSVKSAESNVILQKLSQDAGRVIRDVLAKKNPNVIPLNARYSALADYMYNVLKNPQGISASGGIFSTGAKAAKAGGDALINLLYKAASIGK